MKELSSARNTAEIIRKYGFSVQKRFGQNFLTDEHVLDRIMDAADVSADDHVIEIGPGLGTMTQRLCSRAKKVVAIEIDKDLIPILSDTLSDCDNVKVINADVMKTDLGAIIKGEFGGHTAKVIANLPYYITTPIVMSLLEGRFDIESITIMVQKEVAERMRAVPGTKDYGALSLAVSYYADTYIAANVPPNCFLPRPKVGSCVIRLTVKRSPDVYVSDEKQMFALIRGAFNQRRKTLVNAVSNYEGLSFSKEDVEAALRELSMSPSIRGEELGLQQFATLSDVLTQSSSYGKISKIMG